jgi:transcriptional regulator GlxA family with amidase domain
MSGVAMLRVARQNDLVTQEETTSKALRRFAAHLDLHLDHMPMEVQVMIAYIHAHLFESTLSVRAITTACKTRNNNVTTKFRQATGKGIWEYVVSRRIRG